MKIISLEAENIKKLRAVQIKPTGELVQITGRNGQGKTSILDSIWWALAGTKTVQAAPIRRGEKRAHIKLEIGAEKVSLIVERHFSETGSTLTVESPDGARFKSPQALLDGLLGTLTFDPLAFVSEGPAKQYETLRRLAPVDVDIDALDGLNLRDYEERTRVNRDAKSAKAQAEGVAVPDAPTGDVIDTAALKDQMAQAAATNTEIERRRGLLQQATTEVAHLRDQASSQRAEADRLRQEAVRLEQSATDLEQRAAVTETALSAEPPLPDGVDVNAIRTELDNAEEHNRAVARFIDLRDRKALYLANAEQLEKQSRELTETMEARTKAKADAIAKAPMPVPGLGFGDGIVLFDGLPFEQASGADQIRVSLAVAMKLNPKLKVIRINEASSLDPDNLALIAGIAKENDYQVWTHRVDTSGKVGIVIEDGQVIAVDGEPVAAPAGA